MFRFIHTSDWQIGKVFRFVDEKIMGLLQRARLDAITHIGRQAQQYDARCVLVAGDVYDMEALAPQSLMQPLERMRAFEDVAWHLLPGNHDPHRPNGLWDQLIPRLPPNVHVHKAPEPAEIGGGAAILLPAPLHRKQALEDPTAFMDDAETRPDLPRIGLAHGSITSFDTAGTSTHNLIAPDRPQRANLAYLALGDWHGQKQINARCWYAGTPETDAFDVEGGGGALLVTLGGQDETPSVTQLDTGTYTWQRWRAHIASRDNIEQLADALRNAAATPDRLLVDLTVEGTLSLDDRRIFEETIETSVAAALCHLRVHDANLLAEPTREDLDSIDRGGFVRTAAERLLAQAERDEGGNSKLAQAALRRLYLEHKKLEAKKQ